MSQRGRSYYRSNTRRIFYSSLTRFSNANRDICMKVSEFLKVTSVGSTRVLWMIVILANLSYFFEHISFRLKYTYTAVRSHLPSPSKNAAVLCLMLSTSSSVKGVSSLPPPFSLSEEASSPLAGASPPSPPSWTVSNSRMERCPIPSDCSDVSSSDRAPRNRNRMRDRGGRVRYVVRQ